MPGSPVAPTKGSPQGTAADLTLDKILDEAGWPKNATVRGRAATVVTRESGGNANACCGKKCKTKQAGACAQQDSEDRGIFQINSAAHPDVSDGCAYDPVCNARAALRISKNGTDWSAWSSSGSTMPAVGNAKTVKISGQDAPGNLLDKATGAVSGALDPLSGLVNILGTLVGLIKGLFEASTWLRIGKVLAGFALLLLGVATLFKKDVGAVAKAAAIA